MDDMTKPNTRVKKSGHLAEEIEKELRALIDKGQYRPGAKLPTENVLAELYGVSRPVVREAIAGLRASGLIISRRGSGVFVSETPKSDTRALFLGDWPERVPEVVDALELRAAVEVQAARLAAQRASMAQIETIHELHGKFAQQINAAAAVENADFDFHQGIAQATNNASFVAFLGQLGQRTIPRTNLTIDRDTQAYVHYMARLKDEHQAILEAIEERDPALAGQAMEAHLLGSLKRYRELARQNLQN